MREIIFTTILLLLHSPPLLAHPLKVGFADITVRKTEIELLLSVNLFELDLLLSLDRNLNAQVEPAELESKTPEILEYLTGKIKVSLGHEPLPMEAGPFRIGRSSDGKQTFEARLTFRSSRPLEDTFTIQCEPLTDLGPDHQTIAKISREGRIEQFVFQKGVTYEGKPRGFLAYAVQFLGLGMHHIFIGYDHIAFLLGLILMGGSLLNIIKIVTSFTLAHSITLSLAALDIVTLPSRLVESGIALSVAYVALENLFFKSFDRRWLVSFFFGFVHGFGFANVLKDMSLPQSGLISSLFFFNFGVEVGQVLIVSIILPFLLSLRKSQFHQMVVRAASAVIFSVGVLWFYQRAF
ncbi:MAG: HupE/UreJ family protein [Candidatus Methylomirabilales bacterium]